MANAGTVNINLVAQTAAFMGDMKRAVGSVASLETMVGRAQVLVGGFLGVQALRSVVAWTGGIMQSMDATAKFADRIGTTTEFLSTMAHAADLSGVANETLTNGLQRMVKNVSEAANGNKALAASFGELRLNANDLAALAPEEQFAQLSEAVRAVGNAGDRTRLVMDVFGKTGAEMIPVLDLGVQGLQDMREEADRLGLTFSRMEAAKVEAANDALSRVGAAATGIGRTIAIEVSPLVTALANDFVKQANAMGGWKNIVLGALQSVVTGIRYVATAWDAVKAGFSFLQFAGNNLAVVFLKGADGVVKAVQWISGVWDNWVQFVQDTTALIGYAIKAGWEKMQQPVADFVQFVGSQLATMLEASANAVRRLDIEMADSLAEAAGKVRAGTGTMSADAQRNATDATEAMNQAAQDVALSWDNLFTVKTGGSEGIQALISEYETAGQDLGDTFWGQWNAVTEEESMTGIMSWFDRVKVEADTMAEVTASQIKARQEDLKSAAVDERAAVVEHETWLTAFLGDEATKRLKWEKMTQEQKFQFTAGVLGNLATLQNSHSRRAFQIGKAAAVAQTVINTAQAAMGAYSAMSSIPFVGPALGVAAAAAAVAAGAVQISNINGTSFGGGGSVSSSGGSVPLVGGEPVGIGQAGVTGAPRNSLQINFTGLSDNQILNGQQVRTLIDQINEAQADGSTVVNVRAA